MILLGLGGTGQGLALQALIDNILKKGEVGLGYRLHEWDSFDALWHYGYTARSWDRSKKVVSESTINGIVPTNNRVSYTSKYPVHKNSNTSRDSGFV